MVSIYERGDRVSLNNPRDQVVKAFHSGLSYPQTVLYRPLSFVTLSVLALYKAILAPGSRTSWREACGLNRVLPPPAPFLWFVSVSFPHGMCDQKIPVSVVYVVFRK